MFGVLGFFGGAGGGIAYVLVYNRKNSLFIRVLPECKISSLLLLFDSASTCRWGLFIVAKKWSPCSHTHQPSPGSVERALSSFKAVIKEARSTSDQKDVQKQRVVQETVSFAF